MGEPQVVRAGAAALSFPPRRVAEADLAETARNRFDVASFGIVEQFKLQPSQRLFKAKGRNPLRKDDRLDEGQELKGSLLH